MVRKRKIADLVREMETLKTISLGQLLKELFIKAAEKAKTSDRTSYQKRIYREWMDHHAKLIFRFYEWQYNKAKSGKDDVQDFISSPYFFRFSLPKTRGEDEETNKALVLAARKKWKLQNSLREKVKNASHYRIHNRGDRNRADRICDIKQALQLALGKDAERIPESLLRELSDKPREEILYKVLAFLSKVPLESLKRKILKVAIINDKDPTEYGENPAAAVLFALSGSRDFAAYNLWVKALYQKPSEKAASLQHK